MENIKSYDQFVNESIAIKEGLMSNIDQLAKDSKTVEDFIKKFFKEFGDKIKKNKGSEEWLRDLYTDAVGDSQ